MCSVERKRKLIRRREDKWKQWQLLKRRRIRAENNHFKRLIRLSLREVV